MGTGGDLIAVGVVGLLGFAGYKKLKVSGDDVNTSGGTSGAGTLSPMAKAYSQDSNSAPITNYYTADASEGDKTTIYVDEGETKKESSTADNTTTFNDSDGESPLISSDGVGSLSDYNALPDGTKKEAMADLFQSYPADDGGSWTPTYPSGEGTSTYIPKPITEAEPTVSKPWYQFW